MELRITSIVLVGHCNEEPRLQELIGTIVFREEAGQLVPKLVDHSSQTVKGSNAHPYSIEMIWKSKGDYRISISESAGGTGVTLTLDKAESKYHFITGHARDSGSSGPISNGGPELTDALDELFFPE